MSDRLRRISIAATVGVYVLLMILARFPTQTKVVQIPNPWDGRSEPGLYAESGTFGVEFTPDFSWIRDSDLTLRIINPTKDPINARFAFVLGPSICGFVPSVSQMPNFIRIDQGGRYGGTLKMRPETAKRFKVKIENQPCKVDTDPRTFLGSLSQLDVKLLRID